MRILLLSVILLVVLAPVSVAFAQITTTQALSFGEAILTNNDTPREILLRRNGNVMSDPEYIFLTNPQVGIYQITGGVPNRRLDTVTVTVDQQVIGGGQTFTIDTFDIQSPNRLDGAGDGTITIGARLLSSGDGTPYSGPILHSGLMTLEVTYQ